MSIPSSTNICQVVAMLLEVGKTDIDACAHTCDDTVSPPPLRSKGHYLVKQSTNQWNSSAWWQCELSPCRQMPEPSLPACDPKHSWEWS